MYRWVFLGIFLIVLALRSIAPVFIEDHLNKFLANVSPVYEVHIGDVSLSFIRGAYRFEKVTGKLKRNGQKFLDVGVIDVSLAFRELLNGKIVTDIVVDGADVSLTKAVFEQPDEPAPPKPTASGTAKPQTKLERRTEEGKTAANKLFPLKISRMDLKNSAIEFAEAANLPKELQWRMTSLNGRISNLIPSPSEPFVQLIGHGTILDSADLKIAAKVNRSSKPVDWEIDGVIRDLLLVKANPLLLNKVPLDFGAGTADLYIEAVSRDGKIEGYAKPFLEDVTVLQRDQKFEGGKHVLIEFGAAFLNLILRDPKHKSVAAKIPFKKEPNGEFKIDKDTALDTILQHGFSGGIEPGIEDKFNLDFPRKPRKPELTATNEVNQ